MQDTRESIFYENFVNYSSIYYISRFEIRRGGGREIRREGNILHIFSSRFTGDFEFLNIITVPLKECSGEGVTRLG